MTSRFVDRKRIASIYDIPDEMMDEPVKVLEQDIESEVRMLTTTISAEHIKRGADSEGLDLYMARRHNHFIERLEAVGFIISQEPHVAHHDTISGGAVIVLSVRVTRGGVTEVDRQVRDDCGQGYDGYAATYNPKFWDGEYD